MQSMAVRGFIGHARAGRMRSRTADARRSRRSLRMLG
jgi:hypothetical protein